METAQHECVIHSNQQKDYKVFIHKVKLDVWIERLMNPQSIKCLSYIENECRTLKVSQAKNK